jgi:propionyl-CoA synthetase
MDYADFYRRSIDAPSQFWDAEAARIDWQQPYSTVLDYSRAPFARWFVGGRTNLCHNAVDRWLLQQGDSIALVAISSETGSEQSYTFHELHREVSRLAAVMLELGVGQGDRVLVYMPMIAEAAFAMLACARIGAVHSVVFGGFASHSLAARIDDATPKLIISADAGSRGGKRIAYKPLLDAALELTVHKPASVLLVDRGLAPMQLDSPRDQLYGPLRLRHMDAVVPVCWLESNEPSYILYTSGTTGKPKGVLRDVGSYAVALAASMQHIFCGGPGQTFFSTSDVGWVVGHSYIVYGPLIAGMATVMYEGLPINPDAGVWWRIVEKWRVTHMFSAPTAVRVLRKHPPEMITRHDLSSLKTLYLAGEPLDQPTSQWIGGVLGIPVVDNYWQTETGWPVLAIAPGKGLNASKPGSPGVPMYGYRVKTVDENSGATCAAGQKGLVVIAGPLPPGCMQTIYKDDARFLSSYWRKDGDDHLYSTSDWGVCDEDGYFTILGRADDVINVAGHRLGTRELEECIAGHPAVAEVAVVGVADELKGQVAIAFVIARQPGTAGTLGAQVMDLVDRQLGAIARPARVHVVTALPKTRSGKLLRRSLQALCEQRDLGDLSTLEDADSLQQIRLTLLASNGAA